MALSLDRSKLKGGAVTAFYIRTAASSVWASVTYLRNGRANFETLSVKNAKGINIPHAVKMTATIQTLAASSLTGVVEVLDSMVAAEVDVQLELDNGQVFDSSLIAPASGEAGAGFSWKWVSDADRTDVAFLEFRMERIMSIANAETALAGSLGTVTVANSGFANWLQAQADILPAGINTIKAGAGAYTTHHFGIIRNGKFNAETLTVTDSYGRNVADGRIKVNFEAEMLQASSTEVNQLDTIAGLDWDWQLVFANGRTFQADSLLGFDCNLEVGSDREGMSFIKIMGEGVIPSTSWDACWT